MKNQESDKKPGWVRIIAGKWRGKRLKVPDGDGLRPTPDRVRETLFNWLAPVLPGAYCLDAFAGSGVLGFEAMSRGAAQVVMIDQSADVIAHLQREQKAFAAGNVSIYRADVPQQLRAESRPFDIVFLDPPYQADILFACCRYLEDHGLLADGAYIYLEANHLIKDNELPVTWRLIKNGKAGQVYYHLAYRELT